MSRYAGDPDGEYVQSARERIYGRAASSREGRASLAVMALAVSVFLLIGAVSARQITGPGPARNILEAAVAVATEIDQVIAEDHEALRQMAESSDAASFTIPDYPIDVSLTRDEILNSSDAQLRGLILERSSGLIYASGLDAFDRTGNQSFSRFSSLGMLEFAVGQVSAANHDRANALAIAFLLAVAATACFALLAGEGWRRLRAVGLGTLIGALPGVALFGLLWFIAGRVGGQNDFASDLRDIVQATLRAALRNYVVGLVLGAVLAAFGIGFGMAESRLATIPGRLDDE